MCVQSPRFFDYPSSLCNLNVKDECHSPLRTPTSTCAHRGLLDWLLGAFVEANLHRTSVSKKVVCWRLEPTFSRTRTQCSREALFIGITRTTVLYAKVDWSMLQRHRLAKVYRPLLERQHLQLPPIVLPAGGIHEFQNSVPGYTLVKLLSSPHLGTSMRWSYRL
ncbi:hypothetical protein CPB83DRAFT_60293 [Crepidotus variabilis]|uniref:Uncharacterized protein n=1 Tax=Crepidotus variabilis TaxID=179855 RepID=A0A9P6E6C8_9AGAR|nr:hypothetical protein CPB83DRAFT_60293 [Crepidotus variabilis]